RDRFADRDVVARDGGQDGPAVGGRPDAGRIHGVGGAWIAGEPATANQNRRGIAGAVRTIAAAERNPARVLAGPAVPDGPVTKGGGESGLGKCKSEKSE